MVACEQASKSWTCNEIRSICECIFDARSGSVFAGAWVGESRGFASHDVCALTWVNSKCCDSNKHFAMLNSTNFAFHLFIQANSSHHTDTHTHHTREKLNACLTCIWQTFPRWNNKDLPKNIQTLSTNKHSPTSLKSIAATNILFSVSFLAWQLIV